MREFNAKGGEASAPHLYNVEMGWKATNTLLPLIEARVKFIEARIAKSKQPRVIAQLQDELLTLKQCAQVLEDINARHLAKIKKQLEAVK